MLVALLGGQIALGLLLHGAWDLWAQSLTIIFLIIGIFLWLSLCFFKGKVPIPTRHSLLWSLGLAALSGVSAWFSPLKVYSQPIWAASCCGLFIFPAMTLTSAQERRHLEQVVRYLAWVLVLIAVYQHFHGSPRAPSLLLNENVFAGTILLLLPTAFRCKDGWLTGALLLCLWWTRSVGAMLGLSAGVILCRRKFGPIAYWSSVIVGVSALIATYAKIHSPEILHRQMWWQAAWQMFLEKPWLGFGPGTFAYVVPSVVTTTPELHTLFAHQHFLETAAEKGLLYFLFWFFSLAIILFRADGAKKFGPIAVLIHGLFDYPLSLPGVFWLFCFSVGLTLPESDEAILIKVKYRAVYIAFALLVAFPACSWVWNNWRADRLRAQAIAVINNQGSMKEADSLLATSESIRPSPEASRIRAEIILASLKETVSAPLLLQAAEHLKKSVFLDPFRMSNWIMLESIYRQLGQNERAKNIHDQAIKTCPLLRSNSI